MAVVTINIQTRDRRIPMLMEVDPKLPSEQTILGFLQHGLAYEPDIAEVMMRAIEPGDVLLDVGANAGFFTLLMALVSGPNGHVVSFEPAEDNLTRLRHNIVLNGLTNVTVIGQPAGSTAEIVSFYLNSDDSGGHAIWNPGDFPLNLKSRANPRMLRLQATTIDAELERLGLPPPKLIKIDTEGAEHSVLQGARRLLADHKVPYIIAELHEFGLEATGSSQHALRQFMQDFGYATFALYWDRSLPKFIPPATRLTSKHFFNLLFSTPDDVAKLWNLEQFDATIRRSPDR